MWGLLFEALKDVLKLGAEMGRLFGKGVDQLGTQEGRSFVCESWPPTAAKRSREVVPLIMHRAVLASPAYS